VYRATASHSESKERLDKVCTTSRSAPIVAWCVCMNVAYSGTSRKGLKLRVTQLKKIIKSKTRVQDRSRRGVGAWCAAPGSRITHSFIPWSRVLEKLTGPQLVKKFPAFYGTRRFITAFTSARHLSLP